MLTAEQPEIRSYAFIGARDLTKVPPKGLQMYRRIAQICGERGYTVETGGAPGGHQEAAEACLRAGGHVRLHLPWESYELPWVGAMQSEYSDRVVVAGTSPLQDINAVMSIAHHPAPERLSVPEKRLMARNYQIVVGTNAVIAIPRPPCQGGTAQGIRLAEVLGIPVYNLSLPSGREMYFQRLKEANHAA